MPLVTGLVGAVVRLVPALVGVYVLALIIDALAPKFGGEKNAAQALKIAVYSSTPGWVAGVLATSCRRWACWPRSPSLYGVYLLYLGLPRLMKCPQEKTVGYTLVVVACAIGICHRHRPGGRARSPAAGGGRDGRCSRPLSRRVFRASA